MFSPGVNQSYVFVNIAMAKGNNCAVVNFETHFAALQPIQWIFNEFKIQHYSSIVERRAFFLVDASWPWIDHPRQYLALRDASSRIGRRSYHG